MKILYIVNARIPSPRAYGLQIMKTAEAFMSAGATIEVVSPTRRYRSPGDPFAYYGVTHRFELASLVIPDFLHYGRFGFLVSTIWFSEKVRWMKSFWQADIIYSRDALVLLQYLLLGRILVFEAHHKPTFAARIVARRAHRLVVISQGLREEYEKIGIAKEKIIVAPDAVDEHLFDGVLGQADARAQLGFDEHVKVVLYAGHLYERKGAATLANAAGLLPEAKCVFVGGSPEEVTVFKKHWGGAENIRIEGHVPHESVPLYLRAADILVIPNSGKDEDSARFTSPMKLFEYMASGTPIIASDLPSLREILSEDSAYFVEADNAEALATGIKSILVDIRSAQERAERARSVVMEHSWSARGQTILAAL